MKRHRRVHVTGAGSALATLLFLAVVGTAGAATPITFRHGHAHAHAYGILRGIHSKARFTFHVRAGQHVRVKITGQGPTRGIVTSPQGQQDGSPGGVVFDDTVTQTGRYRLLVTEDSMAEAWHGRVRVDVWRH